jgi:hypothetical protein
VADPIVFEIPLTPTPQKFGITLGGVDYILTVTWEAVPDGGWVLSIADSSNRPIINGIKMVTGANLLAGYEYLGLTGTLAVQTDHDTDALPTFDNLGLTSHLYFVPG